MIDHAIDIPTTLFGSANDEDLQRREICIMNHGQNAKIQHYRGTYASSLQAESVSLAGITPTRCAKFGTEIPHKGSPQMEAMEPALCIYGAILGT